MLLTIVIVAFVGFAQAKVNAPCDSTSECDASECCVDALVHTIFGWPKSGACDAIRVLREGETCFADRTYPKGVLPSRCNGKCSTGLECKDNRCRDPSKPQLKQCLRQSDCGHGECCRQDPSSLFYSPVCMKSNVRMLQKNNKCIPNVRARNSPYQCPIECDVGLSCQKFDHNKFNIPGDMGHLFDNVYHCAVDTTRTTSAPTKPTTKPTITTAAPPATTMDPGSGEEIELL